MILKQNSKPGRSRIFYSVLAALSLLLVFLLMVNYIFQDSEKEGFDALRLQAQQLKDDITLQMISDQENLLTLARMASNHHEDGTGFQRMIDSFEAIGLIDNIAFLLPDNTMLTRAGTFDAKGMLSFEDEVRRGAYISGRIYDVTNPELELVRSAVPVISDGKTVAMLYGSIRLDALARRYVPKAEAANADLYLLERKSGDFIIDTLHESLGNIDALGNRSAKKGYSYQQMLSEIRDGHAGYTAFHSDLADDYLYFYYMPLEIGNWQLLLSQPESTLFARANSIGYLLGAAFLMVVLVMVLYTSLVTVSEQRQAGMISTASRIRKLLIEINQHHESILSALESISLYARSRSAFYADSEGEDYHHIIPTAKSELLTGEDRRYFVDALTRYASRNSKDRSVTVTLVRLDTNAKLQLEEPELYEFLKQRNIRCVCFAAIASKDGLSSILGVVNPGRNDQIRALLSEIAVCFAMAIYNKGYLNRTETTAVTDSLTGLSNRLAYKRAIAAFDSKMSDQFSCVYLDVNELHIINNKYGHAAGDEMLLFIAYTLRQSFDGCHIYRMGGDEFLVFCEGMPREEVVLRVEGLKEKVEAMNYHVSIGMDFRSKNIDTEAVVKEAEKRMYEAKAEYYQQKELMRAAENNEESSAGRTYLGVYCVSFNNDTAYSILESHYFKKFADYKDSFSKALFNYIHDAVRPEHHRAMVGSLKYDVLRSMLQENHTPSIAYDKLNGQRILLTVYALPGQTDINDTIWLFESVMEDGQP